MNILIVGLLVIILAINIFNIGMIIRTARWIGVHDAFSEDKAIKLDDMYFTLYLSGPMVNWSSLKRTKDNKYWIDLKHWRFVRLTMFAMMAFLLFVNVYLLLFFVSAD